VARGCRAPYPSRVRLAAPARPFRADEALPGGVQGEGRPDLAGGSGGCSENDDDSDNDSDDDSDNDDGNDSDNDSDTDSDGDFGGGGKPYVRRNGSVATNRTMA
jgi:hypothetical protein